MSVRLGRSLTTERSAPVRGEEIRRQPGILELLFFLQLFERLVSVALVRTLKCVHGVTPHVQPARNLGPVRTRWKHLPGGTYRTGSAQQVAPLAQVHMRNRQ